MTNGPDPETPRTPPNQANEFHELERVRKGAFLRGAILGAVITFGCIVFFVLAACASML